MDLDFLLIHKNAKKKKQLGQCPAILTEQAWSITHIALILLPHHSNIESCDVTPTSIHVKATTTFFCGAASLLCCTRWLLESVDEIRCCDHSNESYWAVLSCGTVYYAVQGGSNFWVCGWNPKVWSFKWTQLSSTPCSTVYNAVQNYALTFWVCGWNPKNVSGTIQIKATEQYFPVVLFYHAVQGGSNFWVFGWNPKVWPLKWKLLSSFFYDTVIFFTF